MTEHRGLRFNNGKLRMDLLPKFANKEFAKIMNIMSDIM